MHPLRLGEGLDLASNRAVLSDEAHQRVTGRETQSTFRFGHGYPVLAAKDLLRAEILLVVIPAGACLSSLDLLFAASSPLGDQRNP